MLRLILVITFFLSCVCSKELWAEQSVSAGLNLMEKDRLCQLLINDSNKFPILPPSPLPVWLERHMAERFGFKYQKNVKCEISQEVLQPEDPFAASIYFMCMNKPAQLAKSLDKAIEQGFYDEQKFYVFFKDVFNDTEFKSYLGRILDNKSKHKKLINKQLLLLYEEDQKDRKKNVLSDEGANLRINDQRRRKNVYEIIRSKQLYTEEDYFHAAMILQHGDSSKDYLLAHQLSLEAVKINPYYDSIRWLTAAALDRYLLSTGQPSLFGTQFLVTKNVVQLQETCDIPLKVKYFWRVPDASEQKRQIEELNR